MHSFIEDIACRSHILV